MTDEQERTRQVVEDALFSLSRMLAGDLPLLRLRLMQARDRSSLDYLLDPALATLMVWESRLEKLVGDLTQEWQDGLRRDWK